MHVQVSSQSIEDRGVLRFITAGSVDDGKSTLIGRLLYDSRGILSDQLAALTRVAERRAGATVGASAAIDLSLLTDGLEAEREQGITIDVAYRYFATARRKFIIADTPGHEQYTRNMVTGASTADAAIILIDATRVQDGQLLAQTRRHSALLQLLGVRQIVVAVNKMDRVNFSEAAFDSIVAAYRKLADQLGIVEFTPIPVSALDGDNIVSLSDRTPWYAGPPLLDWLEHAPTAQDHEALEQTPFRFSVQLVLRGFEPGEGGARAYGGRVASGSISVGDNVLIQPGGARAQIASIETFDGTIEQARAGQSVALRLDRELDISRGDLIVLESAAASIADKFEADLSWLDDETSHAGRKYWLRHGTRSVQARIADVDFVLDLNQMQWRESASPEIALARNEIARVKISTQQPLAFDAYRSLRAGGAFVLVDTTTHRTVAAGMIRGSA